MTVVVEEYAKIKDLLGYMTEEEKVEVDAILRAELPIWTPLEGPQRQAFESQADVLFYGGSAGGGKTDLLCGLGLTQHVKTIIYRREGTQLLGILDRLADILATRDGFNGQTHVWRIPGSH